MQDDARDRIANVARREHNVRERERTVEKESRKEARKYLLEARSEIERTIKELKTRGEAAADEAIDELGRDARRRAEEMAAKQADVLDRLENEERAVARKRGSVPPVGARARGRSTTRSRSGRSAARSAACSTSAARRQSSSSARSS